MVKDEKYYELLAFEAYLRRASALDAPFMLKGSLVTRQYLPDPSIRLVEDIDWVYLDHVDDTNASGSIFSTWCTTVTETKMADNVVYRSFRENDFWRGIDYAMSDDFPTVNTDLECSIEGKTYDVMLDISFNLDMDIRPVPLLYRPVTGEPFLISRTCPLSLQVAWKLHQMLVRPRYKDIFDLIYLLKHHDFGQQALRECISALISECVRDGISLRDDMQYLMADAGNVVLSYYNTGTNSISAPMESLPELMNKLLPAMRNAGFTPELIDGLPALPGAATSLQAKMEEIRENEEKRKAEEQADKLQNEMREQRRKLLESIPPRNPTPYARHARAEREPNDEAKTNNGVNGLIDKMRTWLGLKD